MNDPMKEKRAELAKMFDELDTARTKMREKPPTEAEGEAIEKMVEEAAALQSEIDRYDDLNTKASKTVENGRRAIDPVLPPEPNTKRRQTAPDGQQVAGYLSLGSYLAASEGMRKFIDMGMPKGQQFKLADIGAYLYESKSQGPRGRFVPVSQKFIDDAIETKAVPTLGADVIAPQFVSDFVRVTEHDMLTLRDVLNVATTSSSAIEYNRLVSYTRAAATVAHGSTKPESTMELDTPTAIVRT